MKQEGWNTAKPVYQYTLDGDFIKRFESLTEAQEETGIDRRNISNCCLHKHCNRGGKYRWLYENETDNASAIFAMYPIKKKIYTDEELIQILSQFEYKSECPHLVSIAKKRGLLHLLNFKRKNNPWSDCLYCVYVYEFPETRNVYVGLSNNMHRRDREHRYSENSAVFEYSAKNGIPIPKPIIKLSGIGPEEAQIQEDIWKLRYKKTGWNILNKAPTGPGIGSLGSMKRISNKTIIEAASLCETKKEFGERFPRLYERARSRHIVHLLGLKNAEPEIQRIHTEESCYYCASKCRTAKEMNEKYPSAYVVSNRNGWAKQYWWFENPQQRRIVCSKGFVIKMFKNTDKLCSFFKCTRSKLKYELSKNHNLYGWGVHYIETGEIEYNIPDFEHRLVI